MNLRFYGASCRSSGPVWLAVLIALVAVVDAGIGLLERLQSARLGEGLILDLRTRVFEHVQRMPVAFFTRTRTGALVSRLNNDVIGAQRAFTSALSGVVTNVIVLVLTLGVMLSLSWQITLLALLLLPLFLYPARRVGATVGRLEREATGHDAAMTSQMTERFSAPGATLVKLFGRPHAEAAEFEHRATRVRGIGVRSAVAVEVFFRSLTLVSGLAQALVFGVGGYLALRSDLDPGTVVTMALLLSRLYGPLTALGTARLDIVTALVSFERVFEVLDIRPLIVERPDPNLSFDAIRSAVGVVTQDGHLFHDTVAANLRYADPDATDDALWDALERARLATLIRSLPDGLDTVVGERGYRLSGGERQRLTIARLLLARPRVVILDEATAHLDAESEAAVQAALAEALEGRTAVVIAHRLSTIRSADEILVVDDGKIVERGTHEALLGAGGRYLGLYRTQFADTQFADTEFADTPVDGPDTRRTGPIVV